MQIELKSIQERTGKTFLFVTHDQEEALTMSDVIVVMNEGRIEQIGDPKTLYDRPASRFVANFIGDTNLLDGTVAAVEGDAVTLDWGGSPVRAGNGRAPGARRARHRRGPPRGAPPLAHRRARPDPRAASATASSRAPTPRSRSTSAAAAPSAPSSTPTRIARLAGDAVWVGWPPESATVLRD